MPIGAPTTQPPVFVVTTGRSGSTMLARLLHSHPEITVISDLFEPVGPMPYLDTGIVTGREFWATISAPAHPERIRRWRRRPTEELLYLPPRDEDVSLLNCYTLPFLAGGDPGALAEQVRLAVEGFPPGPCTTQMLRLFAWLRDHDGGTRWVERTGGSLPHVPGLVERFGDTARFVHLHRDPREVAISMQTGSFFGLYLALTRDPRLEGWGCGQPADLLGLAEMVVRWEIDAASALASVPPARVLRMAYEDLVERPERHLADLAEFVLERSSRPNDRRWATARAADVRLAPCRFGTLPKAMQRALDAATKPAREVLDRA